MQFQFGHPGEAVHYNLMLLNRSADTLTIDLSGRSWFNWDLTVDPTQVVAPPDTSHPVSVTVQIPMTPTTGVDVERVTAVTEGVMTYTTSAYMITIAGRHHFADLSPDYWADGPIQYLVDRGVIGGYADDTFRPDQNVTRAQFAKMLVGAMGWPLIAPPTPTFSDVPATYWAYSYIETAVAHGVIGGYSDGSFRPDAGITRAQVAKMIYLARGWQMDPPPQSSFSDVSTGDWFYAYAEAVNSAEVMTGYSDGTFRPNAPTTRAQVAKILVLGLFSEPDN